MNGPLEIPRLPFAVDMCVPASDLTGRLQISFRPGHPDRERLPSCEGATRMFVVAANRQMFTPGSSPTEMSLVARRRVADGIDLEHRVESLPHASLDVYLALLAHLDLVGEPLIRVSISLDDGSSGSWVPEPRATVGRPRDPGFLVSDPGDYAWKEPIDVWLEFTRAVTPGEVKLIDEAMCTWGYFVAMGGFDLGLRHHEFTPEFGTVSHVEPNVVRYSKELFDAPSSAVDALVNTARGLGRIGLGLASLTIEQ